MKVLFDAWEAQAVGLDNEGKTEEAKALRARTAAFHVTSLISSNLKLAALQKAHREAYEDIQKEKENLRSIHESYEGLHEVTSINKEGEPQLNVEHFFSNAVTTFLKMHIGYPTRRIYRLGENDSDVMDILKWICTEEGKEALDPDSQCG